MKDQRRSRPRTQLRFILRLLATIAGTVASMVIIVVVYREWTADDHPLPVGACTVAYVKEGGNATTAIREALRHLGIDPDSVDVASAALRSEIREVYPGSPVSVCATTDGNDVATVGGINMGG